MQHKCDTHILRHLPSVESFLTKLTFRRLQKWRVYAGKERQYTESRSFSSSLESIVESASFALVVRASATLKVVGPPHHSRSGFGGGQHRGQRLLASQICQIMELDVPRHAALATDPEEPLAGGGIDHGSRLVQDAHGAVVAVGGGWGALAATVAAGGPWRPRRTPAFATPQL